MPRSRGLPGKANHFEQVTKVGTAAMPDRQPLSGRDEVTPEGRRPLITREVLESSLNCKYKGSLKLDGQTGTQAGGDDPLIPAAESGFRLRAISRLASGYAEQEIRRGVSATTALLGQGLPLILDATVEGSTVSLRLDGLKKEAGPSLLGDFHYVPVLTHEGERIGKAQRRLIEVLALAVGELQGRVPSMGVVVHGDACRVVRVRFKEGLEHARRLVEEIGSWSASGSGPKPVLNDHCRACEFRQRCLDRATAEDDLSLLRGMSEKEIGRLRKRGIFTVTQLSYTFRPRRPNKRVERRGRPHDFALQALAIREHKVFVLGRPEIPLGPVSIYLDVEGDVERGAVYLIGMVVVDEGFEERYSFWADGRDRELGIFEQLLDVVGRHPQSHLYYYGSFEARFLRKMGKSAEYGEAVAKIVANSTNILKTIHGHVYFPVYSNGLKEIGRRLGCRWTDDDATGLSAIAWRSLWEKTGDASLRVRIERYNMEDCLALRRVTEFLHAVAQRGDDPGGQPPASVQDTEVVSTGRLAALSGPRHWFRKDQLTEDFAAVNRSASFDYQRERVYLKTNPTVRHAVSGLTRRGRVRMQDVLRRKISRTVEIKCWKCIYCKSSGVKRRPDLIHRKFVYDLEIREGGIRRRVVEYTAATHRCPACKTSFLPPRYKRRGHAARYGHSLKCWVVNQHVAHRSSYPVITAMMRDYFGLSVPRPDLCRFMHELAERYAPVRSKIIGELVVGKLLHADETQAKLRSGHTGYVWVFTNMEAVAYVYRDSREGAFLHELLSGFRGVLVSDFYAAYDSLPCRQQKCLVHLIRDLNDDLLSNPFDEEYKSLVADFGHLLRRIIAAVDTHGLKAHLLSKYRGEVDRYFNSLDARSFRSEVAEKYRTRFLGCRDKLFEFLGHDGVPWNNNNAEHAIKHFANYRVLADGRMTEDGLNNYLTLLSIYETCKYKGISFLGFLLSGTQDLEAYHERQRRKRRGITSNPCLRLPRPQRRGRAGPSK